MYAYRLAAFMFVMALLIVAAPPTAAQTPPPPFTLYTLGPNIMPGPWAVVFAHARGATIELRCQPPTGPERSLRGIPIDRPAVITVAFSERPCALGSTYTIILLEWAHAVPTDPYGPPIIYGPFREGDGTATHVFLPLTRSAP